MSIIEQACKFATDIASDNSHGYDQIKRWGKDYDCSSLVISAYESAGLKVKEAGASYTGNMRQAFVKCGFKAIIYDRTLALKRGDVLLNEQHHTALYLGNGSIVQASINEKGTTTGGKTGDQTGKEIAVGSFYEYRKGWQYVLRYDETTPKEEVKTVNVEIRRLVQGDICSEVSLVQTLLNALGYKGANGKSLTTDGNFGNNTLTAVKNYQKAHGFPTDGIVGAMTWGALLKENY